MHGQVRRCVDQHLPGLQFGRDPVRPGKILGRMQDDSPYRVLLAIAIPSSSVENVVIVITGPNTSICAISDEGSTLVSTVGSM
jgi:hypothetical protein